MNIFPAIDLFEGKAVRLLKGDYKKMTVYHENPLEVTADFERAGARFLHIVDLEGAKTGETKNRKLIEQIAQNTSFFIQAGGGIRTMETIEAYLGAGVDRVILGTAAIQDETFLKKALERFGEKIAVGIDVKDGKAAIKGWTSVSTFSCAELFEKMCGLGVKTIICTDISRDGGMAGSNAALYQELSERFAVDLIASGGVSSIEDVKRLKDLKLSGAIIGKAYYTGAIAIKEAIEVAR